MIMRGRFYTVPLFLSFRLPHPLSFRAVSRNPVILLSFRPPSRNPERKKRPNDFRLAFLIFLDSGSRPGMTKSSGPG